MADLDLNNGVELHSFDEIGALGDSDYVYVSVGGITYKIKKSNLGISGGGINELVREAGDCVNPQANPAPLSSLIGATAVEKKVRLFSATVNQATLDAQELPETIGSGDFTIKVRGIVTTLGTTNTLSYSVRLYSAGNGDSYDGAYQAKSVLVNVGTDHGQFQGDYFDMEFVFNTTTHNISGGDTLAVKITRNATSDTLGSTFAFCNYKVILP